MLPSYQGLANAPVRRIPNLILAGRWAGFRPVQRCFAKEKAKDYGVRRQSVAATALWPCAERLQSLTKRAEEIRYDTESATIS